MRVLVAVSLLAAAAIAAAFVVAGRDSGSEDTYRGSRPPTAIALPSFALRDERGRAVRSAGLRGRTVVVTFLETRCREACPVIASVIGQALAQLTPEQRAATAALAISTHPADDSPAAARAFVRRHGVSGRLRYLLGSERELRPVWRSFSVLPALDSGDANVHSAPVRVYDTDGEWVSTLHAGADLTAESLSHDIALAAR